MPYYYYFEVLPRSGRNQSVVRRYNMSDVRPDVAERFFQRLSSLLPWRYFVQETESARRLPRVRKPIYNR